MYNIMEDLSDHSYKPSRIIYDYAYQVGFCYATFMADQYFTHESKEHQRSLRAVQEIEKKTTIARGMASCNSGIRRAFEVSNESLLAACTSLEKPIKSHIEKSLIAHYSNEHLQGYKILQEAAYYWAISDPTEESYVFIADCVQYVIHHIEDYICATD